MQMQEVTGGLQFPEGPVAMADGSVVLVEMRRGTLTRVTADGRRETIAQLGGGPNGAAIGPDGACYVCNNGDAWSWLEGEAHLPGGPPATRHAGRVGDLFQHGATVQVPLAAAGAAPALQRLSLAAHSEAARN